MKKNGFTLAELLIALLIISVLTVVGIKTFKGYSKSVKYIYSNTYYVLDRALYNAANYWVPQNYGDREAFRWGRMPDNSMIPFSPEQGTERLCKALIEYINPVDRNTCSAAKAVDDSGNDNLFTDENVQFTATNGVRFWISRRYPASALDNSEKFFIIYADLNGKELPNSMTDSDPDIFAFAALQNGRICPLGLPEISSEYLTTRFVYQDNDGNLKYSEPSKPYAYTKAEAWGYYLTGAKAKGTVIDDATVLDPQEPFTYNGYIRSKISSSSKIYSFLGGKSMGEFVRDYSNFKNESGTVNINFKSEAPYHCAWRSTDECYIVIDKYTY